MNVHVKLTTAIPPMQPVLTHLDHSPVNVWQVSMETVLLAPVSKYCFTSVGIFVHLFSS